MTSRDGVTGNEYRPLDTLPTIVEAAQDQGVETSPRWMGRLRVRIPVARMGSVPVTDHGMRTQLGGAAPSTRAIGAVCPNGRGLCLSGYRGG